ncbi:hypothetical protein RHA1_ro11089 (plasmid) [Rhodococcus jostii RHA1]|uniref:Uncharacterized protein n=1 Tax=Rhodococcus jostii (strain RHA1) TaxID=101510 RepID=Q0RVF0_RHOJR|nr:hypothetical protein RHA1_ro11089 [Rhodococcus jostii RHA1]
MVDTAESGVHGAEQGLRPTAHHQLTEDCATLPAVQHLPDSGHSGTEPSLAKAPRRPHPQPPGEHRRGRAAAFGVCSPPAGIILFRTALTHGSPETDCGTVHTSGDNSTQHRDDQQAPGRPPLATTVGRAPAETPPVLPPISWRQPVRRRVIPMSDRIS